MENEEKTVEQPKFYKNKKFIIIFVVLLITILVVVVLISLLRGSTAQSDGTIAPLGEDIANPQNVQTSLGFSVLNLNAEENTPITADLNLQAYSDIGISGGTVVLTYDPNMITDVTVTPVTGDTSLLPNAVFSNVIYNPNNIVISFELPQGTPPGIGQGRIAEITFTPVVYNKENVTKISYDLTRSEIYSTSGETASLKLSKADLDVTITPQSIAPDAQERLLQQQELIQTAQ